MNWHETIEFIRNEPDFEALVKDAYFDEDLKKNVDRFGNSAEFKETSKLIQAFAPHGKKILDIGAGNGISSINFAMQGFDVSVVEPNPSDSVGANAIRKLVALYNLANVTVYENYAEDIKFPDESFDVVYVRQVMHHAYDLTTFTKEAARVLKKDGTLFTIRDHVVFDKKDKEAFLKIHPLHKFYGGENAFTTKEYKDAFEKAGLRIAQEIKYFDSVINYFPRTEDSVESFKKEAYENLKKSLRQKIGMLAKFPFVLKLYEMKNQFDVNSNAYYEKLLPGRMYSYVLQKRK